MKKILILLMLAFVIFKCSAERSFEDEINEYVETSESLESVIDIPAIIEYKDAKIGLSLIKDTDDNDVLCLSDMMVDRNGTISFITHGEYNLIFNYHDKFGFSWVTSAYDENSDELVFYDEDSTPNNKYVYGLFNHHVNDLTYGKKGNVKSKTCSFSYDDQEIQVTLWTLKLKKNEEFNFQKLYYKISND